MDFRFRGKSGHAANITGMTESDPNQSSTRFGIRLSGVTEYLAGTARITPA
jgi:hypothetical protein